MELTGKQEAIHGTLFKCKTSNKHFTIDVYRQHTSNSGKKCYFIVGSKDCLFEESILMTAIYKGYFKKGLTNIIAIKSNKN